jgi:hypothetical protein
MIHELILSFSQVTAEKKALLWVAYVRTFMNGDQRFCISDLSVYDTLGSYQTCYHTSHET